MAEIAGEYLRKGSQVYIEGKLKTREWGKDRIKRYVTEMHVDINGTMQLLGGRPQNQQQGGDPYNQGSQQQYNQAPRQQAQRPQQATQRPAPQQPAQQPATDFDNFDDDIPL